MSNAPTDKFSPTTLSARGALALAALVPSVLIAWGGYARRWAGDDGFINLRVVKQLLAGHGFVLNAGERVEAVTSPGWVFTLWGLAELGLDLETTAWVVALALTTLGVACVALAAPLALRERDDFVLALPIGVLVYAALPAAWDYATSALENGLGIAYLGLGYLLVARATRRTHEPRAWSALFLGLAPLVRPDHALFGLTLTLVLASTAPSLRARLIVLALAALPGLAYQVFRMGYFAALVPNTALAKAAFDARWDQGLLYLENLLEVYALYVPLACALLTLLVAAYALAKRAPRRLLLPLALSFTGLLHMLYVVRLGGDFMHARMLLPGLFALLAPIAVVVPRTWHASSAPKLAALLVIAGWALFASGQHMGGNVHGIGDERAWHAREAGIEQPTRLDDYVRFSFHFDSLNVKRRVAEGCPRGFDSLADDATDTCRRVALPDPMDGQLSDQPPAAVLPLAEHVAPASVVATVGFRPLGIAGNVLGLRINVTDYYALADPVASRLELFGRGRPGHEKSFPTTWFAARYAAEHATRDPGVRSAKHALSCGLLSELSRATREPLTFSRFLRNLTLAVPLHFVRIPLDPRAAERAFCAEDA